MIAELPPEIRAIRTAAAIARETQTRVLRLRGEGARETASWLLPSRLHLRDAQARQSLFLNADGRPIADVIVCADDEDYLLLVDGPCDALAHAREHARPDTGVEDLSIDHDVIELHGPWAWELLSEVLGADLLALPYLNFFRIDEGTCLRAGRTGEFGYHLIVPRAERDAIRRRLLDRKNDFDLEEVSSEALSLCAFENWFFDAAHVPEGATPVELSLEWRLAPDRDYLGRDAIERHRPHASSRQCCLLAESELAAGDAVMLGDRKIGVVTRAAFSHVRGEHIAAALVDRALAHGGIDRFRVRGAKVRTLAPPLGDNQSLYVDPRRHAYASRDEVVLPPLARRGRAPMEA